ncbi:SEL1-like repeat protein [Pseudomonas mangiferae]|uniref:Sel1 repeat family protein n=1 Tax=Pseudomonas mangiferae TaxID=2593654 RepID=A0A553GUM5_9PSED|nr:sel1 repeat family protein [Pseudomonas mangiferae]TRX73191.1 sel1 repeat family protein [Pseudomonas mangiferae]
MPFRFLPDTSRSVPPLPLRVALWLLDESPLGRTDGGKRLAGRLLRLPAQRGVVQAQSRLGRLLCHDAADLCARRRGQEWLRQAARAGDPQARQALDQLNPQLRLNARTRPR